MAHRGGNYGARGPEHALSPVRALPTTREARQDGVLQRVGLKAGPTPTSEYLEAVALFGRALNEALLRPSNRSHPQKIV